MSTALSPEAPAIPPSVRVAVLTRTRDRTAMLRRAMASVTAQTLPSGHILWAVLNDGGDPAPVDAVVREARDAGRLVHVHHHAASQGLVHGLNVLLSMTPAAPYCVVHDDDDSWSPAFLEKTVAWLDAHPDATAVATQAVYIEERFDGTNMPVEVKRGAFNPKLVAYDLCELADHNLTPPIALLMRRAAVDEAGGYDESLPAVEDWDLVLRLLMRGDIGVVPEPLANYHVRMNQVGAAANTIQGGWRTHVIGESMIRNRHLRADMAAGRAGLGMLMATAHATRGMTELRRVQVMHNRMRGKWPYRLLRRLLGKGD